MQLFEFFKKLFGFDSESLEPTSEQKRDFLEKATWHEAGHIIGGFLVQLPPKYAYINVDRERGYVTRHDNAFLEINSIRWLICVGGWAVQRKHYDMDSCKMSVGYQVNNPKYTTDWELLRKPSIETMDLISQVFYNQEIERFTSKVYKMLRKKRILKKKQIGKLYNEFMKNGEIRSVMNDLKHEINSFSFCNHKCEECNKELCEFH